MSTWSFILSNLCAEEVLSVVVMSKTFFKFSIFAFLKSKTAFSLNTSSFTRSNKFFKNPLFNSSKVLSLNLSFKVNFWFPAFNAELILLKTFSFSTSKLLLIVGFSSTKGKFSWLFLILLSCSSKFASGLYFAFIIGAIAFLIFSGNALLLLK